VNVTRRAVMDQFTGAVLHRCCRTPIIPAA
jgi:hypothetical protein